MRHSGNPIPVSDFSWKRRLSLCIVIQYNPVFDRMKILNIKIYRELLDGW